MELAWDSLLAVLTDFQVAFLSVAEGGGRAADSGYFTRFNRFSCVHCCMRYTM